MFALFALALLQAAPAPAPKAGAAPRAERKVDVKFDDAFFKGADANGDAWLSQAEFTGTIERTLLSEMRRYPDALAKFEPTLPKFRDSIATMYRMLDKDSNGRLTRAELAKAGAPPAGARPPAGAK